MVGQNVCVQQSSPVLMIQPTSCPVPSCLVHADREVLVWSRHYTALRTYVTRLHLSKAVKQLPRRHSSLPLALRDNYLPKSTLAASLTMPVHHPRHKAKECMSTSPIAARSTGRAELWLPWFLPRVSALTSSVAVEHAQPQTLGGLAPLQSLSRRNCRRNFCRCEATFSRVRPSTFMACMAHNTSQLLPAY